MIELPSQSFNILAAATEIEPTPYYGVGFKGVYAIGSMLVGLLLWKMAVVMILEYSDTVFQVTGPEVLVLRSSRWEYRLVGYWGGGNTWSMT